MTTKLQDRRYRGLISRIRLRAATTALALAREALAKSVRKVSLVSMTTRFCVSFVALALAVVLGAGCARASEVTISYKVFPGGTEVPGLKTETATGKGLTVSLTAPGIGKPPVFTACSVNASPCPSGDLIAYEFLFWNVNGTIACSTTPSPSCSSRFKYTPPDLHGFATAWYQATGGGGNCPPNPALGPPTCYVTTYAFSDNKDAVIPNTPIAWVDPDTQTPPAWTSPSTTVSTLSLTGSVTIDAVTYIGEPPGKPPLVPPDCKLCCFPVFQSWLQLPVTPLTGSSFTVLQYGTQYVIAFFLDRGLGCSPGPPPPPTCTPGPFAKCT